jgi:probable HAF family extracellular repeat protein
MNIFRQLRNLWIPCVTTVVLACCGNAVAQASYKVTDLGTEGNDNLGCAMSVNNEGWTEIMAGQFAPQQNDFVPAQPLHARVLIDVEGSKIDLETLGGPDSWMMWGEINDFGQVVGFSDTDVPDPNGEDICLFGKGLTCRPFLWEPGRRMSALPTLGGNNGQASAINNRGEIVGFAEDGTVDSSCPANTRNDRTQLPVLWENGKAKAKPLPTGNDPGGNALWINEKGQIVGFTGPCGAKNHAVVWDRDNDNVNTLPDNGTGAEAFGNNNRGQIVGFVGAPGSGTPNAALWQNDMLINLGFLPGDIGGIASGINNKGQVVGSNFDSHFDWSDGFIYENGVMTNLNTLIPHSSNLYVTMANKINERGQISGMATVRSGPETGNVHAVLLTPVNESIGRSVADEEPTHPKSNVPLNAKQLLERFGLDRIER